MTDNPRIVAIEWARLLGQRPRHAGSNARLGEHGLNVRVPILRITAEDGSTGFGACHAGPERAAELLGQPLNRFYSAEQGVLEAGWPFEYALWDLAGQRVGQPVYALAATLAGRSSAETLRVPCYDTTLYFDDLHVASDAEAAELIANEARSGYERGHRSFKIKVGRGARHLPLEQGTQRDIIIVHAVRAAIGSTAKLMLDANNGYNLNLAKRVLTETADCGIFWIEEAFHEDDILYRDLREWLDAHHLPILIADGEGQADPRLIAWARAGLVNVIQYDIFGYGFTRWLTLGRELDAIGVHTAPHHYGGHYGNYVACHLAAAIQGFTFVEWDEATTEGLDTTAYRIDNGQTIVPATAGFGLHLDEATFQHAIERDGLKRALKVQL